MQPFHLAILILLLIGVQTQNNVCYSNCLKGFCVPNNPLACQACDSGLLEINNQCITTNVQPVNVLLFRPLSAS